MSVDHDKAEALFDAALKLKREERAAFLANACAGDTQLRRQVEELLEAAGDAEAFLPTEPRTIRAEGPLTEKAGDRIGRYKLLQRIGEGGCGVVYMAEQEEPVRRRVALKVIKLGMDTRSVIARFEAERQALALMDHPNIATVLDAGATETGRPFFVMELVRGIKITDYCDQQNLSTRERLDLFIQVCHAIQHAHQKGVIHRDIKPSNILVTVNAGVPVLKVIDFGIAKATGQRLTEKTLFTAFEQFVGTPAYMSPEQAGMTSLDIDTRSDIYALGVLLYELLTGRTPFDARRLLAAGLDEMRRTIREQEPVRPSTRLIALPGEELTTAARHRHTEVPKLIHLVRGDLDWIVMKCLEKDRTRRYETANALAQDLERHLKHEPVVARPPSTVYRAQKFVRRNKVMVSAAAMVAGVLVLGVFVSTWQAVRATRAVREQRRLREDAEQNHLARVAREVTLPEIQKLIANDDYTAAFKRIEQARKHIPQDPVLGELASQVSGFISVETSPPRAEVFIKDYSNVEGEWDFVGRSPLEKARVSGTYKRLKICLPGYETAEGAVMAWRAGPPGLFKAKLDKAGALPPGMTRIEGDKFTPSMNGLDLTSLPELNLGDYLIDRYEVSNRQFREFVEAGGYRKPEFWKQRFLKEGRELSWEEAMRLFVDKSGQPGPALWELGRYPAEQDDYPVTGVSWFEAAAYAEFAGKRLPTLYHWNRAAVSPDEPNLRNADCIGLILPLNNYGGKGPVPVGKSPGMTPSGVYDMAGNAKEWCWNETIDGRRLVLGGGWSDPQYGFPWADRYSPFFRDATFGFRCMKLLADEGVWKDTARAVAFEPLLAGDPKPCSEEVFQVYRRLYDYGKSTPLNARLELTEDVTRYTRVEMVSFDAAYGEERMMAYLFVPRAGQPPYQTVMYWPGDYAVMVRSIFDYFPKDGADRLTKNGRAFVFPVLYGTLDRKLPQEKISKIPVVERARMEAKDFRRTIDYLETRPEFNTSKLAFEGQSWGGWWGVNLAAIENRIRVAVLQGGGLFPTLPQEFNPVNFAPRVTIPILMQNGKYEMFPLETNQKVLLRLFGTPEQDKQLKLYETGHAIWIKLSEVTKDESEFLDKYLGPVK